MVRVLLPFRGVAVLLLAASTVMGQTPEPPAELPLESESPSSPDFLRQFSSEKNHPLLTLMVDGQLTSFDSASASAAAPAAAAEASRLQPKPQTPSASSACETVEACPVEEMACPMVPTFLPYAYPPPPPPCHGHKCHRRHKHSQCGGNGPGYGNPYLGWPCAMGCGLTCYGAPLSYQPQGGCCHRRHCKHGCAQNYGPPYPGCGSPYGGGYGGGYGLMGGGGYGMMDGYGFMDANFCGGCAPYMPPPPPPQQCHCRKCQRKHGCQADYGFPYGGGYGGGYGQMGYGGGFMDGGYCGGCAPFMPPPPQQQCHCRKCQRKHGHQGSGYQGCGYPGWPAYPVPGANMADCGYNAYGYPGNCGCSKHHRCFGRFHHCHHQAPPPYPYCAYPQMMPCMQMGPFCNDCAFEGEMGSAPFAGSISN